MKKQDSIILVLARYIAMEYLYGTLYIECFHRQRRGNVSGHLLGENDKFTGPGK